MSSWTCFKSEGHVRDSLGWMTQQLEVIFGELGIAQYLSAFVEQGFDSWETILDITESDLDALGVKLGHRRKLQRRIANSRGVAPGTSLATVIQQAEEARLAENQRPEAQRQDGRETNTIVVTKRKYRRHPKPDENAPERPPSAYVLFSNKMRDELKGRNLTFTEIAKLVGENWQSLSQAEKEPYESQAQAIKDKYHSDLAEYKKTPEYKKYTVYLQEFKAKHAVQSTDKEGSKRVKLDAGVGRNGTPSRRSRSASDQEDHPPSEPLASRQQRLDSAVSVKESPYSPSATPASHASPGASIHSPVTASLDRHSPERSPTFSTSPRDMPLPPRRNSNWVEEQRIELPNAQRHLPSLSDVFENQRFAPLGHHQNEPNGHPFHREHMSNSPGPMPGLVGGDGRTPVLKKEDSVSTGSLSSGSSYGFPRTPIEGSLPIHALLASKPNHFESGQIQSYFQGAPLPDHKPSFGHQTPNGGGLPATNGYHSGGIPQGPAMNHHASHGYGPRPPATAPPQQGKGDANLDGMSALLKAGEIVDRRAQ
ncbi:hypothetical protein OQA88_3684 [Cercophora sp. LCS_1]